MFRTILIVLACLLVAVKVQAQGKFGDNPLVIDKASLLELESTSKGFLPSRLTTLQRDAQTQWDEAHIIYNLDEDCLQIYIAGTWQCLNYAADTSIYTINSSLTSDRFVGLDGFDLSFDGSGGDTVIITDAGYLGVGTSTPDARLDVDGGTVRFSDYGSGTNNGAETYLLGVESNGDVIEVTPALDSFLIVDDTLYISQNIDNVPANYVNLKPYLTDQQGVDLFDFNESDDVLSISLENNADIDQVDLTKLDTNLYNANANLEGNRIVGLDGNTLTFSGTNDITISLDGDIRVGGDAQLDASLLDADGDVGTAGQVLSSTVGGTDWVDATVDTDDQGLDILTLDGSTNVLDISLDDNGTTHQVDLSPLDSNLYNANGTLEGARNVTMGGNNLTFAGSTDNVVIGSTGDVTVTGSLSLEEELFDSNGEAGTAGQVLSTTATGTDWVDATVDTDDQGLDILTLDGSTNVLDISLDDNGTTHQVDLSPLDSNLYNANGTLEGARTVTMGGNDLTFVGSTDDVVIGSTGDVTVTGSLSLEEELYDSNGDTGTAGQILSSTSMGTDWVDAPSEDNIYNTSGTLDSDRSVSGGGIRSLAFEDVTTMTIAADSTSLTGRVLRGQSTELLQLLSVGEASVLSFNDIATFGSVSSDLVLTAGDSILMTGPVAMRDYGAGTITGTTAYVLGVAADGSVIEIDPSTLDTDTDDQGVDQLTLDASNNLIISLDDNPTTDQVDLSSLAENIYSTDDNLTANRTVGLNSNSLIFDGTADVTISPDGDLRVGGDTQLDAGLLDADGDIGTAGQVLSSDGTVTNWIDAPTGDNIYNSNGALEAIRTVDMNANSLTFDGAGTGDLVIHEDGDVSLGTTTANGDFNAVSDQNQDAFHFTQTNVLTGERDVFTIEDQDGGGDSQDHSSVLKVEKSGALVATATGDLGFSLVELAYTAGGAPAQDSSQYWISGRKTDEGAPLWGVDLTDNDFWSEGGIVLGVNGASDGTYSGGQFIVEPTGEVGIGTTSPSAKLDVAGGLVRLRDYGQETPALKDTTVDYILTVNANGDVRELNTARNTRWFYPPAVIIDASEVTTTTQILDLYAEYRSQMSSPQVASDGAFGSIPYYERDELEYYITFYDDTVLNNVSIDSDGEMSYDIIAVPFDNYTVINVVFVIK